VIFLLEKLDDVVKDSVDFIKIDIEGHERECLEGAVRTLRKHQPLVILEVSRKTMENGKSAAVEFLKENGYLFIYTMRKARGSFRLVPTEKFARKNYRMVLCSPRPVDWR